MSRNLEPEGQILTRPMRHHWAAIDRTQDEGVDHAAFADDLLYPEITPAVPSPGRILLFGIDAVFAGDQDIGEKPISLAPGGENLFRRGIAEDGLDRAQQGLHEIGIMLGQAMQTDMLLRDPLHSGRARRATSDFSVL